MPRPILRALGAAAFVMSFAAAPAAMAGTLTQTFSITRTYSVANPTNFLRTALVPNSDFDLQLLPFVGSGLDQAVFS